MPSVNNLCFLEHNIYRKAGKWWKTYPEKLEDSLVQMLTKTGERWVPLSLPPVRVNQGGLNVKGHLIIPIQITIEKLWNLELISNVVIFYPSCKVVDSFGAFGKILTFKKYNNFSFPHPL